MLCIVCDLDPYDESAAVVRFFGFVFTVIVKNCFRVSVESLNGNVRTFAMLIILLFCSIII